MEETIVKVDHLSHRYSVQWAYRDINFEVPKHGIYGLLGSNGAREIHNDEHYVWCVTAVGRGCLYQGYQYE